MAISFYGAKLLDSGGVQDNKFVQFNIPVILNYRSLGSVNTYVSPDFRCEATVEHANTDATPVDWLDAFLEVFGRTRSNSNYDLVNEKVTFFYESNVNSEKLGFCLKLAYQSGDEYRFLLGREENGIGMLIRFDAYNNSKFYVYQNPTTGAGSISALLVNEEALTASAVSSGVVRNLLSVDNMLIAPYYYNPSKTYDEYIYTNYNNVNRYRAGLMSFNNWYTMLTGQYKSGNVIRLKLGVPKKGLEYIDLSLPIILESSEAKMYTLETDPFPDKGGDSTLPYKNYTSLECQYGTDLLYLLDSIDPNLTHTITLQNGYIEIKYDYIYSAQSSTRAWVITLYHNEKGLTYASYELASFSKSTDNGFADNRGLYLMCPPQYAAANTNSWGNMVGDLAAPYLYEYPNAPLAFFSEIFNKPYNSMGLEYKGTSSDSLIPAFTTNFRNLDFGSVSESLRSYVATYATSIDAIDKEWWKSFLAGAIPRKEINVGDGSVGGGISGGGGGNGNFDDSSDDNTSEGIFGDTSVVIPNTISKIPSDFKVEVGKMYTLLYMDDAGIVKLADTLWKDSFIDYIKSKFAMMDPASIVMSVKLLPYFPGIDSNNLQITNIGGFQLDDAITCREAYAYTSYDAGSIDIDGYFDCFLDYTNTRIQLFLPFIGDVELSTSDVMNHTINLRASFDNMAGMVVYMLTDENDNIIGSWSATCTVDIPLTSGDYTGKIDGMIQAAVQAGAMAMTAGASSVAFAGTVTETATVINSSGDVSQASTTRSGDFFNENKNTSSNAMSQSYKVIGNALSTRPGSGTSSSYSGIAGVLSHLRPCIKITCNKSPLPEDYKQIQGYPSNVSVKLSECEGYTEVNSVHLENMGYATEEEIAEIEEYLKRGVIF